MVDLTQYRELVVRQIIEPLEIFSGFETRNQYSVLTPEGHELLYAYEESGFLSSQVFHTHRPLKLHVVDTQNQLVFTASRSFFWLFSHLHVRDAANRETGVLRRRFALFRRRFALEGPDGRDIAVVKGSLFRPNTFMIDRNGDEVARVTKRWSGIGRETFTDADTFHVQMDT
ncbi:MAG: hypothetical protein L0177_09690, partial [Chloroflexi bacterium]|nr:hypothetical protein [Chloroflexota bacterium]